MRLIREGAVPSKEEEGFTFIDVAPTSPKLAPPHLKPEQRPPTFIPAADDEDVDLMLVDNELMSDTSDAEAGTVEIEDEQSSTFGDWRAARSRISLTRIGPPPRRRLSA